ARETSNPQDATHQVLKDFSDWWCGGQKNTKKLAIAETGTLEVLYEHIAKMYELGAALTLGERRTEQFSFFQDIEIRGSKDNKIDYRDIAGPDSAFLRLLGRIMAELYPKQQLQVIVLDASGHSNKLGVEQTAVRLVWQLVSGSSGGQNIVVTSEIAFRIVDYMVLKANESTDQNIKEILRRASTLSNVNTWKNMFVSDDNYGGKRSTIRMTLNDEVCDPPMLRPEKRPLKPVFIHRFSREENVQDLKAEPVWSCDEGKLGSAEYAKFVERTAIRQATGHAPSTRLSLVRHYVVTTGAMSDCVLGLVQDSEDPRYCWVPTDIQRCSDLVDGSQWISALEQHLKAEPKPSRQLRMTVSEGDAPQFWASAAHTLRARNDALRKMQPPARKVRLLTQHEVLFWFNVGPGVQKRDRVYVTESKCPHQGVCLMGGELKDVEDIVNEEKVPMVRCPRHNKTFDLRTGESLGNCERLRVFPCKFHQGRYYVQVPVAETSGTLQAGLRQHRCSQACT
ncbi:unnamed protein product, partial [Symbiodinium necroappetens]